MSKDINNSTFIHINHSCVDGDILNITMVDVFGGSGISKNRRGPRGAMGPRGLAGSINDYCEFLPKTVLINLQTHENLASFFIEDLSKDIEKDGEKVKTWISRTVKKRTLVGMKPSSKLIKLEDYENRYVLGFEKNNYYCSDVFFLENGYGTSEFLCITFRMFGDDEAVLLTNRINDEQKKDTICEIRVSATEICLDLYGTVEIIQHSCRVWTTLYIECNSDDTTTYCKYDVNGTTGSFTRSQNDFYEGQFWLGSRNDNTMFFNGQVAAVEVYQAKSSSEIPESLKKLVIKNQRVDQYDKQSYP